MITSRRWGSGHVALDELGEARPSLEEVLIERVSARIPKPGGEDAQEIGYSEAMARRSPPGAPSDCSRV